MLPEEIRAALDEIATPAARERLAVYLGELERRVAVIEEKMNPPEPDPLELGSAVFRHTIDAKKALRRA